MNEVQRKYLRQRLEAVYNLKRNEVKQLRPLQPAWPSSEDKIAYVKTKLAEVGLHLSDRYVVGYIDTPADKLYREQSLVRDSWIKDELEKLHDLYNKVMDDVMLEADAESLREALQSLENYKVEE